VSEANLRSSSAFYSRLVRLTKVETHLSAERSALGHRQAVNNIDRKYRAFIWLRGMHHTNGLAATLKLIKERRKEVEQTGRANYDNIEGLGPGAVNAIKAITGNDWDEVVRKMELFETVIKEGFGDDGGVSAMLEGFSEV